MTGVCVAIFVYVLFFGAASCQQIIYSAEKNDCVLNDQTKKILNEKIHSLRSETARIMVNQNKIQEEFYEMFNILIKNVTNIHEDLKSSILQTVMSELYKDCKDYYIHGKTKSGVYEIYPFGIGGKVSVFCDMVTEGGGWTAIQKRFSGSVSFGTLTWAEYKDGLDYVNDSYWIGNDVIHQLTKGRNSSLYVSITLTNGTKLYALFNQFSVADETNKYKLFLGGPVTGTWGVSMLYTGYPNDYNLSGMYFSTPDRDYDRWSDYNCAALWSGGWWFSWCLYASINGQWSPESWSDTLCPNVTECKQIMETLMTIKPH